MRVKNHSTETNTLKTVIHTKMSLIMITSKGKLTKFETRSVTKDKAGRIHRKKDGSKTILMSMMRTMLGAMWKKPETTFRSTRSKLRKTMTKRTISVSSSTMTLMMSNFRNKVSHRNSNGISTTICSNNNLMIIKTLIREMAVAKV